MKKQAILSRLLGRIDQTPGCLADELKTDNPAVLKECGYSPKGA